MKGKELLLKFRGIDDFNRPVFLDVNTKTFYGDTDHLFPFGTKGPDVFDFYRKNNLSLNNCLCFFGYKFNCEPIGSEIRSDIKITIIYEI